MEWLLVHVIVTGCGRVGSGLAVALEEQGHTVAVVDKQRNAFRRLPESFGGQRLVGLGFDRDLLREAGAEDCQAFASVTSGDNSNILAARIARETFEIPNVVARIYDPRRAQIYQRLGIPTVATVAWTTDQVMRRLFSGITTEWTDATGALSLIERALPDVWAGHRLSGLGDGDRFRLVAINRAGGARLAGPQLIGQEGDILHLMVRSDAMAELQGRLADGPADH